MKACEKNHIMESFVRGETQVLVATTVIEVGINVPNATVMLVQNAERFGLSQLHQLRGRVGRGSLKSFCILVTDSKNPITAKRMEAMVKTNDGFELSELDLELRGPGEFFGTAQHGLPRLVLANLYKDTDVLAKVRERVLKMFHVEHSQFLPDFAPLEDKIEQYLNKIKQIAL